MAGRVVDALTVDALTRDIRRTFQGVSAVCLVGSSATRRVAVRSDIDLAVIVENAPTGGDSQMIFGDTRVDVQFFETEWLKSVTRRPLLDLRSLREVCRLREGRLLAGTSCPPLVALRKSPDFLLSPLEAATLLGGVSSDTSSEPATFWLLQGRVIALSILALSLVPTYQKAKWMLPAAREHCPEIASLLIRMTQDSDCGPAAATRQIDEALAAVDAACRLRGYAGYQRVEGAPLAFLRVRDAACDAAALRAEGMLDEACVAAAFALREAFAFLEDPEIAADCEKSTVEAWWFAALSSVYPRISQETPLLRALGQSVEDARQGVETRYSAKLARHCQLRGMQVTASELCTSSLLNLVRLSDRLWMGGRQEDVVVLQGLGIETIVLAAEELQDIPDDLWAPLHVERIPLRDEPVTTTQARRLLHEVGKIAKRLRKREGGVLVTCNRGLNRSALIAGLLLRATDESGSSNVVETIRKCRREALNNDSFRQLLQKS